METNELNWDALYAREAPRVYNYFRFRLGSDSDVEDLTARTFEHAWRSRSRYRQDLADFATWLFKIAQNIGTDYLRARHEHLPLDAALLVTAKESYPDAQFVTMVITVKNTMAAGLVPILRPLLPTYGHLAAMPCTNQLVVVDNFASVKRIEKLIASLDVGTPYVRHPCQGEGSPSQGNAPAHS